MEAQESYALTGVMNGTRCVATVLQTKRGYVAECFNVENQDSLGNPGFYSTYEEAVASIRKVFHA